MYIPRSSYLDSYNPGEASQWVYGSIVPNPRVTLARRLQTLRGMSYDKRPVSSENFQTFLALQNDPEVVGLSKMKLPQTRFGNLASFLDYGSAEGMPVQ